MSRRKTLSPRKKIALLVSAAAVAGGGAFAMASTSNAAPTSVVCDGLATALANNQKFIDGQRADPDAQSEARIANRLAVIEEIKRKQAASGCEAEAGGGAAGSETGAGADAGADAGAGAGTGAGAGAGSSEETAAPAEPGAPQETAATEEPGGAEEAGGGEEAGAGAAGEVVCAGSTVTLSGEGGVPAASSNQFPVGTQLKVTNLDNDKSTTVEVTSVSGSCALLNNAAFEQVREPGKFLIRNARIEKVG
ncbi:hypothetical protein H1V43_02355 [Streptomyces sp. PSKA54]|uniref:Secreted protein n=1 Tax=Streptomyces himalayensis subsp. aureolus TaxID=2758039 RepID=A0A7W2CW85_9ACTN|nr:hypothetical protein [Streptomyces himalayensis]MBA4860241.1 hypothetical protein [Streptomyces himalayensis subsp. aureolus]